MSISRRSLKNAVGKIAGLAFLFLAATSCTKTEEVIVVGPPAKVAKLTVLKPGTGAGFVTSTSTPVTSSPVIDCGTSCVDIFPDGALVTLSATPNPGSTFVGWARDCGTGTSTIATVTMDTAKTCEAKFDLIPVPPPPPIPNHALTVTKTGDGIGTVTSFPSGINCGTGADCVKTYEQGTSLVLFPASGNDSIFTGWSGGCTGSSTNIIITMDSTKTCTANFAISHVLTVVKGGAGTGTVSSIPTGISCGHDCSLILPQGASVRLTATAGTSSRFIEWVGDQDCNSGTSTVTVIMVDNKNCTAIFEQTNILTVTKSGSGTGTVVSFPDGINCGDICTGVFSNFRNVFLQATASSGSLFMGWSGGDCNGSSGSSSVRMDTDKTCAARFDTDTNPAVNISGTSGGANPSVATASSTVVCYDQNGSIQCAQSSDGGANFATSSTVSDVTKFASRPVVAISSTTTVLVVFEEQSNSNTNIMFASSGDGGVTFTTPINISGAGFSSKPVITMTGTSTVLVAWEERNSNGGADTMFARALDGGAFASPVTLTNTGRAFQPVVAASGNTVVVCYEQSGSTQCARSVDEGATFAPSVTIQNPGFAQNPSVGIGVNTIVVCYENGSIQCAQSSDGGANFATPITVSDNSGFSRNPSVAVTSSSVIVTFVSDVNIQIARSVDGGVTFNSPVNMANNAFFQTDTSIAIGDSGVAIVVWNGEEGNNQNVFLKRIQ